LKEKERKREKERKKEKERERDKRDLIEMGIFEIT
jgi:hypothetical protein